MPGFKRCLPLLFIKILKLVCTPRNNVVLLFDPFVLYLCGVQVTKALQHEKQHTRAIMGELLLIFTGILAAHFVHLIVCFCTNKIYDLFKREV
jgi:hypothetical protein